MNQTIAVKCNADKQEAVITTKDGLKVSYKRVNTKHGGYYFVYFLTKSQRTQIKDAVLGVTA